MDLIRLCRPIKKLILAMYSSVSETYGQQEGSAYNLGNLLRRLTLPANVKHWTLTTLRDKLAFFQCHPIIEGADYGHR